jgi:hypothetical protein
MRRARTLVALIGATALSLAAIAPASADSAATYTVTITNLTTGQPFTPPLVASHRPSVDLFEVGEPASEAIMQIAENGNLGPAVEFATESKASKHIADAVVALPDGGPPPILPGESRTFALSSSNGANRISWASMLICTNDGFTGIDSVRLPKKVGDTVSLTADAYDAGTELNTEDLADIVPPCQGLTGVADDMGAPGTGMSDPALAEGGVIAAHPGVIGGSDLLPDLHGWADPVATIVIARDS